MSSPAKQSQGSNSYSISAGIDSLLSSQAPSWLEAVGASIRQLGGDSQQIEEKLELIPESKRTALKEFLRLVSHLPHLSKNAYETLLAATRRGSDQKVVTLPVDPSGVDCWGRRAAHPIDLKRIIVVAKESSLQYQARTSQQSAEQILSQLPESDSARLKVSHARHIEAVDLVKSNLSAQQVISYPDFLKNPAFVKEASLVIALGGDDHLKFLSDNIDDDTPVLGINSDPKNSQGFLLKGNADQLPIILKDLASGQYRFEPWSRLRLRVNGKDIGPALDEIVFVQENISTTARHILEFEGKKVEHASSGLIISTGAGSTGWIDGAGLYLHGEGLTFPPTSRFARFVLREPVRTWAFGTDGVRRGKMPELVEGLIPAGETLLIHSLNKRGGALIMRDSIHATSFPRDSVASVFLDHKPLWVVVPFDSP